TNLPAPQRRRVLDRRGVRGVDDHHPGARDQFVGPPDSGERVDFPGWTDLRADLIASVRKPADVTLPAALVIVPTYNERANLPTLTDGLMRQENVRLLIVDDQSPDGTGDVADGLARTYDGRVKVMHRTGERGLGRSYRDGFKVALQERVDVVCQMDADLSHDPGSCRPSSPPAAMPTSSSVRAMSAMAQSAVGRSAVSSSAASRTYTFPPSRA